VQACSSQQRKIPLAWTTIVVASVFVSGSRDSRRTAGQAFHASARASPGNLFQHHPGPSTQVSHLCSIAKLWLCTAVCAAWRYAHATKMFGMANQPPLALACRMTPLLCSVRSSVRDEEARAAHEVNGMGQPALTFPRRDMRSSHSRRCRILSRPGVQSTAFACAATRNRCTAARNVRS
jgi:hypothetical protein